MVNYKLIAPVGKGRAAKSGSVLSLLSRIPYFFCIKVIPPLRVVNDVLDKGVVDAGMSGGCRWKPFQLDTSEYSGLVAEMKRLRFEHIDPPDWVSTSTDWHYWCWEIGWGIPALENKRQCQQISAVERRLEQAKHISDGAEAARLLHRLVELSIENSRFVNKHRSKRKLPPYRPT